jgi:hypothetical protein
MGAKQAYSIINGLAFLPLCFLGITALLISIIAIVSINPIVVSISTIILKKSGRISQLNRFLSVWSYVLILYRLLLNVIIQHFFLV